MSNKEIEEKFVRDLCSVEFRVKSSTRKLVSNFISQIRQKDCEELIKMLPERIGTFTPTCGYESEEEKGFQKGIIAEQNLIKSNVKQLIKDYYNK